MKHKPWPLVLLALILVLAPAVNVLVNAVSYNVTPGEFIRYYLDMFPWYRSFAFFVLPVVAGLAVFAVRRWSYPVFLLSIIWTLLHNLSAWRTDQFEHYPLWSYVLVFAVNLAVAVWYLQPTIRKVYFDRTLRWWESKPRFLIDMPCSVSARGKLFPAILRDLSEGGAYVRVQGDVTAETDIIFHFSLSTYSIVVPGRVIYRRGGDDAGFGLQFLPDRKERQRIRRLTRAFRLLDLEPSRETRQLGEFRTWVSGVLRGRGLVQLQNR